MDPSESDIPYCVTIARQFGRLFKVVRRAVTSPNLISSADPAGDEALDHGEQFVLGLRVAVVVGSDQVIPSAIPRGMMVTLWTGSESA